MTILQGLSAFVESPDSEGKKETLSVRISFVKLHILMNYADNSSSDPFADIRVSQETKLFIDSSLACTINDNGTSYNLMFGDADSLQTFVSYFNQTQQQYVQDVDSLRKALTGNTDKTVSIPFLNAAAPLLYCIHLLDVKQEIYNTYWFFENLSLDEMKSYALFLHNLIIYMKTNCSATPEMVMTLTDLESSLSLAVKGMSYFFNANVFRYYSNWSELSCEHRRIVYRAKNILTGERVAVKMYKNSNQLESFKNEIRSLCSLCDVPSIIHILQAYCYNGVYYLVEELMQGMTLLDYVKTKGPLKESEARIVIRILLETLNICHERHILHRDIKLDNVMFRTPENRMEDVVLFGFNCSIFAPIGLAEPYSRTEEYMPPEILNNSLYSAKTDMWSLGVLFYGLVTGYFPFGSQTDTILKENITNRSFAENNRFKQSTVKCKDLIHHLLEVDPSKRYSAEEALKHEWFVSNEENSIDTLPLKESTKECLTIVNSKRSIRMMTPARAVYIILRKTEVHRTPEDGILLFKVSPPLEVPVTSIYTNWETNEMWVQVQGNMYYDNQPDRIEGKWILCQRGSHSPYAMDRECILYRGLENTPLFVLSKPSYGDYCLLYPMNHYVIISKVIRNGKDEFGEISDQSMLMFTLSQDKDIARSLSKSYVLLSKDSRPNLEVIIP